MEAVKKKAEPFIFLEKILLKPVRKLSKKKMADMKGGLTYQAKKVNRKLTPTNSHLSIPNRGKISRRQFLIGLAVPVAAVVGALVWKSITARFTVSNLRINSAEAEANEPVTVTVDVANTGYLEGTDSVTLKINGVEESTKEVKLAGRSTMPVSFVITKDVAGTYNVAVEGLTGNFIVKPMQPPIKPELAQRFSQLEPKAKQFKAVVKDDEIIYYEAYDEAGILIGYAFIGRTTVSISIGPESTVPITLLEIVGVVDLDYKVKAVSVTQLSEYIYNTGILGSQFLDQFIGLSVDELDLSPKGKVDAITGATISSSLITDAIRGKIKEIKAH